MNTYRFKTNINCGGCVKNVTPYLNELDEVDTWKVDTDNPDKVLEVVLDEGGPEQVEIAVKRAGFRIEILPN